MPYRHPITAGDADPGQCFSQRGCRAVEFMPRERGAAEIEICRTIRCQFGVSAYRVGERRIAPPTGGAKPVRILGGECRRTHGVQLTGAHHQMIGKPSAVSSLGIRRGGRSVLVAVDTRAARMRRRAGDVANAPAVEADDGHGHGGHRPDRRCGRRGVVASARHERRARSAARPCGVRGSHRVHVVACQRQRRLRRRDIAERAA